jgi:hypothetical protein
MRGLISVFAGLLATTVMAWAEPCRVAQTATLNVHGEPNGRIVGTLNEGTMVSMSSVITVRRHRWAKIGLLQGRTGWVLRNYLLCEGLSRREAGFDEAGGRDAEHGASIARPCLSSAGIHSRREGKKPRLRTGLR